MRTFSFNTVSEDYSARVLKCMMDNYGYIAYFNRANTKEAFQKMYLTAMKAENRAYSDLTPYIKVLARNIMKEHNRAIPYSQFDEDGEVSFVFTQLTTEFDTSIESEDRQHIFGCLQEIYLCHPDDFMLLADVLPRAEAADVQVIKNDELKDAIFGLCKEFNGRLVYYCLCEFLQTLIKSKAKAVSAPNTMRTIALTPADYTFTENLTDRKWLLDKQGNAYGINPRTLRMDNDFNPEFTKFRLAYNTSCAIWKIDCSDFLADVEGKIYVEEGVDNEYIHWCGSKYMLTTPGGDKQLGLSREKYMEIVRHEVILQLLGLKWGTIIAVSPDNIYVKMTKATGFSKLRLQTASGKFYTLPVTAQPVQISRH